jgi:hypothetical protein
MARRTPRLWISPSRDEENIEVFWRRCMARGMVLLLRCIPAGTRGRFFGRDGPAEILFFSCRSIN